MRLELGAQVCGQIDKQRRDQVGDDEVERTGAGGQAALTSAEPPGELVAAGVRGGCLDGDGVGVECNESSRPEQPGGDRQDP